MQRHVLQAVGVEVGAVLGDDRGRVVLQVDLRHDADHRRAPPLGGDGERQLRGGQLLGAVGHEHDAVGGVEAGQVEGADRRVEATDAGHVDEVQAGRQQPPRQRDLDAQQPEVVALVALLAGDVAELHRVERGGLVCPLANVVVTA